MKKTFLTVAVTLAACALVSCSEDAPPPQNMQMLGAGQNQQQPEQQVTVLTKDLIECPASGYKYINAITLAEAAAPPKPLVIDAAVFTQSQTVNENIKIEAKQPNVRPAPEEKEQEVNLDAAADLTPQQGVKLFPPPKIGKQKDFQGKAAQAPNTLSVAISGEAFKVTLGSESIDCNTGFVSNSSTILNSQSPVIAFGTKAGLSVATITELACPAFVTYSAAGAVKFVLAATSVDFTTKLEQPTLPEGLNLDITPKVETVAGSINAPPPGVKAEAAQNPTGDYIYFLTVSNWIGRIKPQMASAGCVEFLDYWAPIAENPAAETLKIEGKSLVIETPIKLINIDLTSGIRSEAAN